MGYTNEMGSSNVQFFESTRTTVPGTSISSSTSRPYTLDNMDVDQGLLMSSLSKAIQIGSVPASVFTAIRDETSYKIGEPIQIPESVLVRIKPEGNTGYVPEKQVLTYLSPLSGAPILNDRTLLGEERGYVVKYMNTYYGNFRYAVTEFAWGNEFNRQKFVNWVNNKFPLLNMYAAELYDLYCQQALVERWDDVIQDKLGAALDQDCAFNPSVLIPGEDPLGYPSYGSTYKGDFTTYLNALSVDSANYFHEGIFEELAYECVRKKIRKVEIPGYGRKWILVVPKVIYYSMRPKWEGLFEKPTLTEKNKYPVFEGCIKEFVISINDRAPEILVNGGTMTINYLYPGGEDSRSDVPYSPSYKVFNVSYVLGSNAINEYLVEDYKFKEEEYDYGRLKGTAITRMSGIQLGGVFSNDSMTNIEHNTSLLVITPALGMY